VRFKIGIFSLGEIALKVYNPGMEQLTGRQLLKIAQQKFGWSRAKLADELGKTEGTIAKWVRLNLPVPRSTMQTIRYWDIHNKADTSPEAQKLG
jgi:hypothetical protein